MSARGMAIVRKRFAGASVVCAYAQPAAGPGWGNTPLWVVLRDPDGKLRQECLQPDEQGAEILTLYGIAASVHRALTGAVERRVRG